MRRIAIVGAGFSGLATAWHLLDKSDACEITLFDSAGIGKGASGIAAGLLHPYAGAHAKLNWLGREGMQSTCHLLEVAAQALGQSVAQRTGLLRPALDPIQEQDFLQCARHADVTWQSRTQCQQLVPGINPLSGLHIPDAITVDTARYLQGLWLACQKRGAVFEQQQIKSAQELSGFDAIVIAMGAATRHLPESAHLPIKPVKGQLLDFRWPEIPQLLLPLNAYAYLIPNRTERTCLAGATFEHDFVTEQPVFKDAVASLMPKIQAVFPLLQEADLIDCRAGVRASTADHRPLVQQIGKDLWTITGMGSKGLLYHSLFAEQLAQRIT